VHGCVALTPRSCCSQMLSKEQISHAATIPRLDARSAQIVGNPDAHSAVDAPYTRPFPSDCTSPSRLGGDAKPDTGDTKYNKNSRLARHVCHRRPGHPAPVSRWGSGEGVYGLAMAKSPRAANVLGSRCRRALGDLAKSIRECPSAGSKRCGEMTLAGRTRWDYFATAPDRGRLHLHRGEAIERRASAAEAA
jgi:hypothetical protein